MSCFCCLDCCLCCLNLAAAAVAAVAVVVSAIASTAVVTAATAAVVLGLEFLGGGVAHQLHKSAVAHGLSGELVIEVHEHFVVGDFHYLPLDAHALLGHHGHTCSGTDVLSVKFAVDVEDFFFQLIDEFGVLHTKGLMGFQGEVEFISLLQSHDVVLEALDERQVHAEDKCVGMLFVELEHARLLLAVDYKDLIHELHIFTCLNFLHL